MSNVDTLPQPLIFPGVNNIRAAAPVVGDGQWKVAADVSVFLHGRLTNQLLSMGGDKAVAPGGSTTYRFWHWPHSQARSNIWLFTLIPTGFFGAHGTFEAPAGTTLLHWSIDGGVAEISRTFIAQAEAAESDTPQEITCKFTVASDSVSSMVLSNLSCFECPMQSITTATGPGSSIPISDTDVTKAAIMAEADGEQSANAVMLAMDTARTRARRSSLFCWANVADGGRTLSSSIHANVFALDPVINARHLYNGTNTAVVDWAVLAKVSGGGGSEVKAIVGSTGVASSVTITSSASTGDWVHGTSTVKTEDMSLLDSNGGIRDSVRETLRFTAKRSIIYAICVGEAG